MDKKSLHRWFPFRMEGTQPKGHDKAGAGRPDRTGHPPWEKGTTHLVPKLLFTHHIISVEVKTQEKVSQVKDN